MDPVPFAELGVPDPLLRVLAADGKTEAFPIQADTLPDSLHGRDILGRGRTGSGKTLAFCIPLAARLCEAAWEPGMSMADYRRNIKAVRASRLAERTAGDFMPHPRGLILAPTRELANQINDVLQPLAQMAGMTTTTVYGGVKYSRQIRDLKSGADIVVACPGRLEDLLRQEALVLSDVSVVVLDEADEMADMGFLPPVKRILAQIRPDAQHMLFSATLDHGIDEVVREFLRDPKVHSVAEPADAGETMEQHVFEIEKSDKNDMVQTLASGTGKRILFTRTKFQAKNLAKKLTQSGIPASELHGNLSQNQRDRNLAAFEQGDVRVMVATDVAARGIDVSDVELVVQVDPPEDPKSFVHRSGRTARAGKSGVVVTLVAPDQRREARRMLKAAGIAVTPVKVRHDSPEVLELVGDQAELVEGWSLDQTQPAGNPRDRKSRGRGRNGGRGASDKAFEHLPMDLTDDGESDEERQERETREMHLRNAAKKERRRRRAAERLARAQADTQTEQDGTSRTDASDARADARTDRSRGRVDRTPNRAERRAGLADPDAERRDYLFEHPEERRGGRNRRNGRDGYDGSSADRDRDRAGRTDREDRRNRRSADRESYNSRSRTSKNGGGKRIHRADENRILHDERGEAAKRHERRMMAKYGNADGPRRRHSKVTRAPFRRMGR
ncbi:DEAD/DEAH box helicase [Bifidobacterium amazonense]|uniref:DEAD/DEAH box helicase n=1 Tax=Bifidobacterium amazonense TaxID=2809027 RepID=A0ABS9VU62_9BIFI|nr:DEAD/DEAH box helicase [Bifidobacterium amazonense]MCH9275511.1 DEAD/DEAH box helicase [Bifidobacterium amazonense]